jgi:hypothetical protein
MTDFAATEDQLQLDRVITQTWGIFSRNVVKLLTLAAIVAGAAMVGALGLVVAAGLIFAVAGPTAGGAAALLFGLFGIFAVIVVSVVLQAAYVQVAIADLNGRPLSVGACLESTLSHIGPLVGISVLMGLGLLAGLIAFVVPAFILLTLWSVVAPVRVVERTEVIATFRRSRELTRGSRWRVFGLIVVYIVISAVVQGTLENLGGPFVAVVASGLMGMLAAIGTAALYMELRRLKDGVAPESLASIFD